MTEEATENRLSRVPLTALYEALKQVKDGRKKRGCRYSLALILTLLLLARQAGETEIRAAAQWIRLRKRWIIPHLHLRRPSVPCVGTYVYALGKIDAQDLLTVVAGCRTRWDNRRSNLWPLMAKRCVGPWGTSRLPNQACMCFRSRKCGPAWSSLSVSVMEKENEMSAVKELLDPV